MINKFYLPVLKSKQGEFDALFKLHESKKKSVVPLFDITPMEWDHATKAKPRTIEVHLQTFCEKKVIKKWPSSNAFIDTSLIDDRQAGGVTCIEYIYNILFSKQIKPLPILRISSPDSLIYGIDNIVLLYGLDNIGIRVTISDITSPTFKENIEELLTKVKFQPTDCHLILDLNDSDFTNIEDFSDGILQAIGDFPHFQLWKSFTICGSSFPATNLIKTGVNLIPRNEWKFYKMVVEKLQLSSLSRDVNYGDYSIVAPGYFEFDPTKMSRSANIRYTHNDNWYVVKGKALKKSEDFKQYVNQAKEIIKSDYYFGEAFSEGDLHIKKCAIGETTPGSPTVWNWVGNNHHFTKVISDLFAN